MDLGSASHALGADAATAWDRRRSAWARRRRQRGMRSRSEFAGLARLQRAPDFLRRSVVPASKSMAKIRCLAETQSVRDIIDRHLRIAQIFYRHLGPQLVEEIAKRSVFVAQFATKRAHRDAEMRGDVVQAGVSSQCREQKGAHLSGDADPVLQSIVQVIAKSEDRRISDFVAELRGAVQPVRVKAGSGFAAAQKRPGIRPPSCIVLRTRAPQTSLQGPRGRTPIP